jgi:hypothetical protein
MKVYFACSIRGGRENAHLYQKIVDVIKESGAELLSELFANQSIDSNKGVSVSDDMNSEDIWKWDLNWVHEADVIIAEVTQPSLGVGYEIAKAEEWKKPILTLFYEPSNKKLSAMIDGSPDNSTYYYSNEQELELKIKEFIKNSS